MTIENGVIEEFVRAVKAIHDTGTPNADRVRYTQACCTFKCSNSYLIDFRPLNC